MSIKLSECSGETVAKLQRSLRLPERPPLLRLALAVGLRECGGVLPEQRDSKGPEIPLKVLLGGRDVLFDSLVLCTIPEVGSPIEASDRRRIYKCLVDHGIELIMQGHSRQAERGDYLAALAREYMSA